jgi:hypothetical protein
LGFWNYNFQIYNVQNLEITRITTFPICNVVYQAGSRRDPSGFLIFYVLRLNNVIFWALSAGHFSNLQRSEPGNNENNNIPHLYTKRGPGGTPCGFFNFLSFLKEEFINLIT